MSEFKPWVNEDGVVIGQNLAPLTERARIGRFFVHNRKVYMAVKPTGILLNSRTIKELYERNYVLAVNVNTGELVFLREDS